MKARVVVSSVCVCSTTVPTRPTITGLASLFFRVWESVIWILGVDGDKEDLLQYFVSLVTSFTA